MRSLTFPIYVWPFDPSVLIISKNDTASRSCAKSLRFRVHILRHNYNSNSRVRNRVIRHEQRLASSTFVDKARTVIVKLNY